MTPPKPKGIFTDPQVVLELQIIGKALNGIRAELARFSGASVEDIKVYFEPVTKKLEKLTRKVS